MKHAPTGALTRASLLACASLCAVSTVQAQSGTWTGITPFGLWSDDANWDGGTVADGAGNTADFSTLDLPDGVFTLAVDTPRTIGSLTFGDSDPLSAGSWLIDNNLDPLNILTLAGAPVLTVGGLGTDASAEISAEIAGVDGLTKAGVGALSLSGANTYGGTTSLTAGRLNINSATAIGTGPLDVAGGTSLGNTGFGAVTLTTNNPQTWNGDFSFEGPQSLNLGTGAVSTGGVARELTVNSGVLTVGGVVDTPGFTKSGPGELLLTANNAATLVGPILLKEGTVRLGGGAANLQNAIGASSNVITFNGGALASNVSTGGNGTYSGFFSNPMVVPAGQSGSFYHSQRGELNSTLTGSGTFNFYTNYVRGELTNADWSGFTGDLNLISAGAGITDFRIKSGTSYFTNCHLHVGTNVIVYQSSNGPNNTVGVTFPIGALSGDDGAILASQPVGGRFLNWQVGSLNTDTTYAGIIRDDTDSGLFGFGITRLYKVGTGTLTLTGTNAYTGDTQVNAGTLAIGDGGATGSLGNTNAIVAAGATLVFNRDDTEDSTYAGILSGDGSVIKRGNGTIVFSGVNTHTAGTTVEEGTIAITNSASLGDAAGPVNFTTANGGITARAAGIVSSRPIAIGSGVTATLAAAAGTDSYSLSGTIGGAGSLAVGGSGLVELAGDNSYGGITTVDSGTLVVSNATGSATSTGAVAVNAGTLGGSGTLSGPVTTSSGVSIRPGALTSASSAVGTLKAGSLSLAGGSTIFVEFSDSTTHDKIQVLDVNGLTTAGASVGNPVLVDLRVENSPAKWVNPGTYDLIEFAGTFTGNPDDLFEVAPDSIQGGLTYSFGVSGNHIRLTVTGAAPSEWQVDADGLWSNPANWLNGVPDGTGVTATLGPVITLPRTITLDSARTVGTLIFNSPQPYTIAGSATLSLNGGVAGAVVTNIQGNHIVQPPLNLATDLDLVFSAETDTLALEGDISGAGGISKSGPGSMTLDGTNTFLGDLGFSNGTLSFASGGLGGGNLTLDGAVLEWAGANSQDISNRTITFGDDAVTFRMDNDVTLANDFGATGAADFVKEGFGTLTLLADTTFAGNTTVAGGSLRLGNGGVTGSVAHDIALADFASRLILDRSDNPVFGNSISGDGGLDLVGTGNITFAAANTFTGTTTIAQGSLVLGDPLALQNSTLEYDLNGGSLSFDDEFAVTLGGLADGVGGGKDLVLDNSLPGPVALTVGGNNGSTDYSGNISGTGSFTKVGTGILTANGDHTHDGGTTVGIGGGLPGGTMEMFGALDTAFLTVTQAGTFNLNEGASVLTTGNIDVAATTGGGALFNQYGGTITAGGAFNMAANRVQANYIKLFGGTAAADSMTLGRTGLNFSAEPLEGSVNDGLLIDGGSLTLTNALNIGNASNSTNSSASARVDNGSLTVGGAVTIGLNNGGRWSVLDIGGGTFSSTDAVTGIQLGGPSVGNATFIVRGGSATVERIALGQGTNGGTHRVRVAGFGELYVGSGGIVDGSASDDGSIVLAGTGTLAAGAAWSTTLDVSLADSPTVKAANANGDPFDITLDGFVGGNGSLTKTGGGTVTLSLASGYTGNTVVNEGTLSLPAATLDDVATVEVTTGAVLDLDYSGTDVVGGFYIDGIKQADGTWGSPTSSATNKTALISGDGILDVISDPFLPWIAGFAVGGLDEKGDDADGDGLTNHEEFGLDSDPSSGAASGKVRSQVEAVGSDQALVLTLPVRDGAVFGGATSKSAVIDGVVYTIAGTNDLSVFDQGVSEIAESSAGMPALNTGWSYRSFRLDGAVGGATPRGPKGFLSATVEEDLP